MELVKTLYFIVVGIYIIRCILAREITPHWLTVFTAVTLHAVYSFGWGGIVFILMTAVISTAAELLSLKTPFNIFGVSYRYDLTHEYFSGRTVLGGVYPMEVTAAWILLKYLSFFLVSVALPFDVHVVTKALLTAVVLVSFDLLIDPYAVHMGAWKWKKPGIFFSAYHGGIFSGGF